MAFEWLGTFNKSQFDRFAAFARQQLADVSRRITHLNTEQRRIGGLTFEYDVGGVPVGTWSATSSTSTYIGRLVAAYEILGGDVFFDLQVRDTETQGVYLVRGTEVSPADRMSNGEIVGARGLADGPSAEYLQSARSWLIAPLHYRKEYLERKIRRALDYSDQLTAELAFLSNVRADAETYNSLEYLFVQINDLLKDFTYRSIYDDKGKDPHGKYTMAPFLPYSLTDADPQVIGSEPAAAGRDNDGFRESGEV